MATSSMGRTVERLRKVLLLPDGGGLTDTQLLELFITRRDEAAFEALVRRHGPMVHGVCRRIALHEHDAEDAFQATFLALARKAASLRQRELVGNWLYGAAYRAALETRTLTARRRAKEKPMATLSEPFTVDETDSIRELLPLLDRELNRLPEKYRVPVVLCELEGRPRKDVARRLGIPEGTLSSRLATARKMLAKRLARHGLSISGGALASALSAQATAAVPAPLLAAAVRIATAATASAVSAHVVALADGVLRALFLAKLKVASAVLVVSVVLTGTGLLAHHALAPELTEQATPAAETREQARTDLYGDPLPEGAVARLGTVRMRHAGLSSFVFLDNKTVLTAGRNRVLRFWDVTNGRQVREVALQGTHNPSWLVGLSPDGKYLSAHDKRKIVLWDVDSGKEIKTFPVRDKCQVNNLFLSPDSKTLAVGWNDHLVSLWDWEKGVEKQFRLPVRPEARHVPSDSTTHASFSPDGKWFVAGAHLQEPLGVFEVATGREVHRLTCFPFGSRVSPDSKHLVVCGWKDDQVNRDPADRETILRYFDLTTGKEEKTIPLGKSTCYRLRFSPDGKVLACTFQDHIRLLDRATGVELNRVVTDGWGPAFSPDGKTLVNSYNLRLHSWDAATGKKHQDGFTDFPGDPLLAVSPDGRSLAVTAWGGRSLSLWEARNGRLLRQFPMEGEGKDGYVRSLMFSPDGRTLFAGHSKGFIQSWDVATGQERQSVQLHDPNRHDRELAWFYQLHVSSDGKHVSTIERGQGDSTRFALWEMATGKLVNRQVPFPREVYGGNWSADGRTVGLPLEGGFTVMDLQSGAARLHIPDALKGPQRHAPEYGFLVGMAGGGWPVASPDERLLAGWHKADGQGFTLGVWEVATGKEVTTLKTGRTDRIALTPDNRFLVTVDDKSLRVWDLATTQERLCRLLPDSAHNVLDGVSVYRLRLSPDGRRAFTTLADGTALVWDLTPALQPAPPLADTAGEKDLAAWWDDLASEDAGRAYAAVWRLEELPEKVVLPFLRKHLRPVGEADFAKVRTLIKELDSDRFETREKASQQLQTLGDAAAPLLREALEKKPTLETRRRLETLLSQAPGLIRSPDVLRRLRALQVVERIPSDAARQLLRELAAGVPYAPETLAAKAAVERLGRRATNP